MRRGKQRTSKSLLFQVLNPRPLLPAGGQKKGQELSTSTQTSRPRYTQRSDRSWVNKGVRYKQYVAAGHFYNDIRKSGGHIVHTLWFNPQDLPGVKPVREKQTGHKCLNNRQTAA